MQGMAAQAERQGALQERRAAQERALLALRDRLEHERAAGGFGRRVGEGGGGVQGEDALGGTGTTPRGNDHPARGDIGGEAEPMPKGRGLI